MIPQCPLCTSTRIRNDDPPLRGYVLAGFGGMMLFAGSFLNADVFAPGMAAEQSRLLLFGGLVFLYGVVLLFRHANRYCDTCGTRFRKPGAPSATHEAHAPRATGSRIDAAMEKAERQLHRQAPGQGVSASPITHSPSRAPLPANQPIEPLLACLKFRDPKQRATAHESLRTLTGADLPEDYEEWAAWWQENKAAYKARRRNG